MPKISSFAVFVAITATLLSTGVVDAQSSRPRSRPRSRPGSQPTSKPAVKLQPAPAVLDVGGVKLSPNKGWKLRPTSGGMRRAELVLPAPTSKPGDEKSTDAELIIYYFGPQGAGDARSNLNRWKSMFARPGEMPKEEFATEGKLQANGMKVTTLTVQGSYLGPSFDPLPQPIHKQMMMAAVVETASGPYYFRAVGSAQTLTHWKKAWQKMLSELEPSGKASSKPRK